MPLRLKIILWGKKQIVNLSKREWFDNEITPRGSRSSHEPSSKKNITWTSESHYNTTHHDVTLGVAVFCSWIQKDSVIVKCYKKITITWFSMAWGLKRMIEQKSVMLKYSNWEKQGCKKLAIASIIMKCSMFIIPLNIFPVFSHPRRYT